MLSYHLSHIYLYQPLRRRALTDGKKVSDLHQPIHNHPNCVDTPCGPQQFSDTIHRNLFPSPLGNLQGLQHAMRMLVLGLNPTTFQAPLDYPRNVSLHTRQPIIPLRVQIHLSGPGVDQKSRSMRLLHQCASSFTCIGHPNHSSEGHKFSAVRHKIGHLPNHPLLLAVLWSHGLHLGLSNDI